MSNQRISRVFIRKGIRTSDIMGLVLISLCPPLTAAVWYFGVRALWLCFLSVGVCIAAEALWEICTRRSLTVSDLSAAVTGLLLALSLPVTTPVWALVFADVMAIIVGKQLFGGIGQNIFNPALVGRAALLLGAAGQVINFTGPYDGISSATPLAGENASMAELLTGSHPGSMGETSAVLLILGFGILYCSGAVKLHAPLGMLSAIAVLSLLFGGESFLTGDAPRAVLSGSALFGAFYMVTDYSTTPTTDRGRLIFGVGAGILTFVLRKFGGAREGVCFAILTMNLFAPLIEELTAPAAYGKVGIGYERKHKAMA